MADDDETAPTTEELATWLTPRQALNLVNQAFRDIRLTARTISERLRGGLIRAAAQSSSWGDAKTVTSVVLIPAHYWSHLSTGGKADWWDSGDVRFFFPRTKHTTQSLTGRYFGVRFEVSSVREWVANLPKKPAPTPAPVAAPAEPPKPAEKKDSPEDFSTWLLPRAAQDLLSHLAQHESADVILTRLQHGEIRAVAKTLSIKGARPDIKETDALIAPHVWNDAAPHFPNPLFWKSADLKFTTASGGLAVALLGVRFDPKDIRALLPAASVAPPPPAPTINVPAAAPKGGRPAKDWWDECWVAVFGQIYRGDLKPRNQAAIENAMADWAHAHGHDASEQSFRTRARLLWAVVKEDKN